MVTKAGNEDEVPEEVKENSWAAHGRPKVPHDAARAIAVALDADGLLVYDAASGYFRRIDPKDLGMPVALEMARQLGR